MKRITLVFVITVVTTAAAVATLAMAPSPVAAQEPRNFVFSMNCTYERGLFRTDTRLPMHDYEAEAAFRIPSRAQAGPAVQEIWIDLSRVNNNFAPGTFIGAGPFIPGANVNEFVWHDLIPRPRHYYRLNALTPGGWTELGRGVFDTPDCIDVIGQLCQLDGTLVVDFGLLDGPPRAGSDEQTVRAVEQWIDLSLFNNGFAPRTFVGAGPFPGAFPSSDEAHPGGFAWVGIVPGRTHYYRINTLYDDGRWRPSFGGSFLSLDCRGLPIPTPDPDDGPTVS